ncbi:MAG TPA: hypothetical protein VI653_19410 [Steroidobacteraceae bacterium]
MAAAELQEKADRPAYVRFKRVAIENKAASLAAGHYVGKDVDFALITPPYSRDVIEVKVEQWLLNMEADVRNNRMSPVWQKDYLEALQAWRNGQEIPLKGTPIRGWGVISPAMVEKLVSINILTVEDLAAVNDEGIRRIGMGGTDLKHKARAWLAQLGDKGPLTMEMAALKQENENLKGSLASLQEQVKHLLAQTGPVAGATVEREESIVPEIPEVRRAGRPRKDA